MSFLHLRRNSCYSGILVVVVRVLVTALYVVLFSHEPNWDFPPDVCSPTNSHSPAEYFEVIVRITVCTRSSFEHWRRYFYFRSIQKWYSTTMPPVKISREELLKYDTFLFDADGVLWKGDVPIPGAVDFVTNLLKSMKRVFIISNNSTKTPEQYLSKIERMGFKGITREQLITPAIVLAAYFRDRPEYAGQPIYLLGVENLKNTLDTMGGVRCFGSGPDHFSSGAYQDFVFSFDMPVIPKAVVCSYDCHLSYPKIMKAATFLKRQEVEFLVTNEDYTFPCPNPDVVVPGAGAVSSTVRAVSGRTPIVFGKPHKPIADFLKKHHHIDAAKTVMFGDRLDTDIQFANDNGFASCFMLTGVNTMDDVKKAESFICVIARSLQGSFKTNQQFLCLKFSTTSITRKDESSKDDKGEKPVESAPKQQGWISKLLTGQQMDPSGWQKQSHSSLLSSSEYIYEFATHNFRPGEKEKYLKAFGNYREEMSNKLPSVALIGSWTVSYGRTKDQAVHLWRHTNGFKDIDNYWREPEQRPPSHVYDLRSYVLTPGSMIEWANAWAKGITFRRDANQDVGGFFAQVGQLYIVYHIWAYPSMCARNETRHATWAKPGWDATVAYTVPLIKKMQSKILTPTEYSQLQ
ncbi:hypothetical protein RB195_009417 [Necator americanus]|uniref:NIPSNAP domain-containing protein n=1 Tax=Necator americanus TaxID=51031 RepID=A0ABR1CUG1_NECAM